MSIYQKKHNRESFTDGILFAVIANNKTITQNVSDKPFFFGNRTIGITRFYNSKSAGERIDRLIAVPHNDIIKEHHKIVIDKDIYDIAQLQIKYDTEPPSMYLSLRKTAIGYKDERTIS